MTLALTEDSFTLTGDANDLLDRVTADLTGLGEHASAPIFYDDTWLVYPVNVIWARDGKAIAVAMGTFAPKTLERLLAYRTIALGTALLGADTVCAVCDAWITNDPQVADARIDAAPGVTIDQLATEPGQVREGITVAVARPTSITYASAEYTGQPGAIQFAPQHTVGDMDGDMAAALRMGFEHAAPPLPQELRPFDVLGTAMEMIDWLLIGAVQVR